MYAIIRVIVTSPPLCRRRFRFHVLVVPRTVYFLASSPDTTAGGRRARRALLLDFTWPPAARDGKRDRCRQTVAENAKYPLSSSGRAGHKGGRRPVGFRPCENSRRRFLRARRGILLVSALKKTHCAKPADVPYAHARGAIVVRAPLPNAVCTGVDRITRDVYCIARATYLYHRVAVA